ncbi:MAG: hypothetical protein HY906_12700 [Deltaproteobacteria bacterium]|nr:hypothetical protein [Deltaproteobacteria bacterium]
MRRFLWLLAALLLAWPAPGQAKLELKLDLEGYYRARWVHVGNVFDTEFMPNTSGVPVTPQKSTDFLVHRVRVVPKLSLGDVASLYVQVDALNNVVWGDNDLATSSSPVFATGTSNTNLLGERIASVEVPRAWLELKLPVGQLRVGRMPSQWGLGLLANDGNGFRNEFDEAYGGSTADRILFATRPIQIFKALRGDRTYKSNLVFAVGYDKIVEEPCEVKNGPIANCTLLSPEELWQRYQEDRTPGSQAFLARPKNDVDQAVLVLLYNAEKIKLVRPDDQLVAGTYIVLRKQRRSFSKEAQPDDVPDKGSFVGIYDAYVKARVTRAYAEGELLAIIGDTTGGVPLPPNSRKDVRLFGGVGRVGYVSPMLDAIFEAGYASGTGDLEGERFTQRPLHPDYGVGLVLYRQVLRERSYQVYSAFNARGFSSQGGVIDSAYIFPRVRFRPPHPKLKGLELIVGVLAAWADKQDDRLFSPTLGGSGRRGKFLGTELDAALKYSFYEDHLRFTFEGGYLVFGEQLRAVDPATGYPVPGDYWARGAWSLQSRIAYVF